MKKTEVHYSEEAEKAVLGCMLVHPKKSLPKFDEALKFSDFFVPAHRILAEIICYIDSCGHEVDVLTVHQELCDRKLDSKVGSPGILADLMSGYVSHETMESYIRIVVKKSKYRALMEMAEGIRSKLEEGEDIETVLSGVQALVDNASTVKEGRIYSGKAPWDALYAYIDSCPLERQKTWLKTGFMQLDACVNSLRPGRSYVIAARPGIGKTALALNIMRNLLIEKKPCGMVSLEMSESEVRQRMLANHASIDTRKIENGLDADGKLKANLVRSEVEAWPLHVLEQSSMNIADLRLRVRQLAHLGCKVIFVDYLQLLSSEDPRASKKKHEELGEITRLTKVMARTFNIPIVMLVQLARMDKDSEPDLENLAGSDSIGRDADCVIIMYKEGEAPDNRRVPITWKIAKNRQGPRGKIPTNFDGPLVRFTEKGIE